MSLRAIFDDMAASQGGEAESQGLARLAQLAEAGGQAFPDDFDPEVVGFVRASRDQVESVGFMEEFHIGLAVSCVGHHSSPFLYRRKGLSAADLSKRLCPCLGRAVAWPRSTV